MDSELINTIPSSPSAAAAAPNYRDLSRKKRRSAKLKQCKLDARREQWLSQCAVKNKVSKEEVDGKSKKMCGGGNRSMENLEVRRREEEHGGRSIQHESDPESLSNSPTSILLGAKDCGTNFTNSSSSSSSSGGCCSGSITEEDDGGDDDTLDNWEAIADALAADEKHEAEQNENPCLGSTPEPEPEPISQAGGMKNGVGPDGENSKQESTRAEPRAIGNSQAWRPDDALRPQSLPNLSKQRSFPTTDRHFGQGGGPWASPSSCPICFEDLDLTDSSFLPCLCGFRLCLFCHKRILEEDGRCPACRKPYEQDPVEAEPSLLGGSLTFRLARSCSMHARS